MNSETKSFMVQNFTNTNQLKKQFNAVYHKSNAVNLSSSNQIDFVVGGVKNRLRRFNSTLLDSFLVNKLHYDGTKFVKISNKKNLSTNEINLEFDEPNFNNYDFNYSKVSKIHNS
jgi:hypothetical protein